MIMKTKHVKNTGTNGQEGENWKITRGAKGANCQGGGQTVKIARGKKISQMGGGHCPFCPIDIVRPLV